MDTYTLEKLRFASGVWEGLILAADAEARTPQVAVSLYDRPVDGASISETDEAGRWLLRVPIPPEMIGDGVQTVLISEADSGVTLGSFSMISGEALGDDLRAEVALLREELDMLKRAFRRHCLETS
ncbi:hypothetical protein [Litorisediminicola beolgyonensis]|uniref:Uncharacterized protein n=1 Tax=Litorisediminicola beolgyonensis TaxID=1173614 RepID=A0ABW3ZIZ1_9RHOB